MDYQPQNPQGGYPGGPYPYPYGMPAQPIPPKPKGFGMATASMVLGIISLSSLLLLRMAIPFLLSGIAIILAILSRGGQKHAWQGKGRIICSISGLCLDIVLCVFSVWLVFSLPKVAPSLVDEMNKVCEEQYGISYDEMMEEIYDLWNVEGFE